MRNIFCQSCASLHCKQGILPFLCVEVVIGKRCKFAHSMKGVQEVEAHGRIITHTFRHSKRGSRPQHRARPLGMPPASAARDLACTASQCLEEHLRS